MKKVFPLFLLLCSILPLTAFRPVENQGLPQGKIVIANRASGSISIIDVRTDQVVNTVDLPGATAEPMYVVYARPGNHVFVGDRANNQVVVFDADSFAVVTTIPAGNGVFHMWSDPQARQLWVSNDIDRTVTVIDPRTLSVITTVAMPADLVAMGGKPHDVLLDPSGNYAFVSLVGLSGESDYVVKFSTSTFAEMARATVGKDPHLSATFRNDLLYVPTQGGNAVTILSRDALAYVTNIAVPGAHGAGMFRNGKYFYTTNLPGGGTDALYTIDTDTNTLVGGPVDAPYAVPHNIALIPVLRKLYVTHSGGAADKVTVYSLSQQNPVPSYQTEVTVGLNPFGLAYVP